MPFRLFTPGPTPVPAELALAMAVPLPHHRTPEFQATFERTSRLLQDIYRTTDPVLLLAASGTGAMEAAVVNLSFPGERVLSIDAGKFGARWGQLLRAYGRDVHEMRLAWGESPQPEDVERQAREWGARCLFVTHSETSTGALADLEAIAGVARRLDALLIVDAITSLGAHRVETGAWGLDCVICGSQKAFMLPPGLAFASLSQRARARLEVNPSPRFYFDFGRALAAAARSQSAWTPAISLVLGLERACERLLEEGLERVWERHRILATAMQSGVQALGLELLAKQPSHVVTAVSLPEIADAVRQTLWTAYGIKVAGGQDAFKGRILRVGHLGAFDASDITMFLAAFEDVLRRQGHPADAGTALAVASPILAQLEKR